LRYSVVIPTFNRKHTLPRAVQSVLAQSVPPLDIIIVDDCSSDESQDTIQQLAAQDSRVRPIFLDVNVGAPTARNVGFSAAQEHLIAFLDSDDRWKPRKAEQQIAILEQNRDAPAAFTNVEYWYGTKRRLGLIAGSVELEDLFVSNVLGGTSSVMVRRSAFAEAGGFTKDMPSCQDWDLWLRLAEIGPLRVAQAHLTEYHFDGGARISKNRARVELGHQRIFTKIEALIDDPEKARRVKAGQSLRMAEIYARQFSDWSATLAHVMQAVKLDPSRFSTKEISRIAALWARSRLGI
jgi:glycosyltransferase involved in cell wall biosynthesis